MLFISKYTTFSNNKIYIVKAIKNKTLGDAL